MSCMRATVFIVWCRYECSLRPLTIWEHPTTVEQKFQAYVHDHPNYFSRYMDADYGWPNLHSHQPPLVRTPCAMHAVVCQPRVLIVLCDWAVCRMMTRRKGGGEMGGGKRQATCGRKADARTGSTVPAPTAPTRKPTCEHTKTTTSTTPTPHSAHGAHRVAIAVPVFACDAQLVWPRTAGLATTSGVCTAKGRGMRRVESALTWWCTAASTTAPASHRTRCVVTNTPTRGVLVVTVVRVTEPVRLPRRLGRCRLQHPSMQAVCEGHP